MRSRIILALIITAFAALPLSAQSPVVAAVAPAPSEAELRKQAFERVWSTVNDKHFEPGFGGVDWLKVREVYEPKALAAKSSADFHAVLRQMLGELKLSHFAVFSAADQPAAAVGGSGVVGIDISMIGGEPVVTRVEKGSAAEAAGVKPGYAIESIDGKTAASLAAAVDLRFKERVLTDSLKNMYRERSVLAALNGKPGSVAKILVRKGSGAPVPIGVTRVAADPELSEAVGNFPAQPVVFESRTLASGIGYIRFNMWVMPQMAKIREAVKGFAGARGIIFDLRGNPGGIGGLAPGVAGLLVKERTSLGTMRSREFEQNFVVFPQANAFAGKVAILTDNASASTSEVFAAGMQEIGRAVVVGDTTAGAVLPSIFETLPTGATFQYAVSDYRSPKDILIEGRGVVPDIPVKPTRKALLAGRDPVLEAAVDSILK